MTTSIRSGSTDGALQLNGVDQITMQATQVLLAKPIAAPVGATGQLVTFDQVGGLGQTWQVLYSSRVIGTTYTNTTSKPIQVAVSVSISQTAVTYALIIVNGITLGYTATPGAVNGESGMTSFIVPPGSTYNISQGVGVSTIQQWVELR